MDQMRFTMAGREAGQQDLGARRAERLIEEVEDFGGERTVFAVGACLGFFFARRWG